ncbi:hypothetical protein [Dehalobacterium formicoaceticum]|uniref:Uncharacterized protein n=1 Tax=Dehalobacterium formicoaceticum TaxID=51515 RepID=A0ABT1Y059_9FIRM|nr:hypothetical protein [Dehalobacterium formicoaceticum]MCR6544250.1 hypothetical protein [Dehalobacterium formicoaceticum]
MTNHAIEEVLAEVIKMRSWYAKEANAENTAIALFDDILEMLESVLD